MQKSNLFFLICLLAICSPLLTLAQTTLGDKSLPEEQVKVQTKHHRPPKERSVRPKKVNVKHTPRYEYYARVEKVAKE